MSFIDTLRFLNEIGPTKAKVIEASEVTPDIEFIIDVFGLDRDQVEFALSIRDKVRVTR